MKNILLFGAGPLPDDTHSICTAASLRTDQFFSVLQKEHRVKLFLIGGENMQGEWTNARTFLISRQSPHLFAKAREIFSSQPFDIALGVNTFPAYVASKILDEKTPFWADLNGWIMAEMQAQAYELEHDHYIGRGWEQEKSILLRADHISTVSEAQRLTTYGELASLGRLTKGSFGKDFVYAIANAAEGEVPPADTEKTLFRGESVPRDAFVICQIGGFNNWLDEKTLFAALEGAMAEEKNIYFVTTGGAIEGVAQNTFSRFQKLAKASSFSDHFIFLGWIQGKYIPNVYAESDMGILADIECLETETGARNRLNEMIKHGLPFLTTRGSEITKDIEKWQCGHVVESGDTSALKNGILMLQRDKNLRFIFSKNAQKVQKEILTNARTISPLLKWLRLDEQELLHLEKTSVSSHNPLSKIRPGLQYLKERGPRKFLKKVFQKGK